MKSEYLNGTPETKREFDSVSGVGHRHKALDRPLNHSAAAFLCQRLVSPILRVRRREGDDCPQNRKCQHGVARKLPKPRLIFKKWNACRSENDRENRNDYANNHENQTESGKAPIFVTGVENIKDFDEMIGIYLIY